MKFCPKCYTHPKLVQSGWAVKSLKCPVCGERYPSAAEIREQREKEPPAHGLPTWWKLWQQGWYKK